MRGTRATRERDRRSRDSGPLGRGEPREAPAGAAGALDQTPEGPTAVAGVEEAEGDFRKNFETTFKARGYTYDQCTPAYHYGYAIGTDSRYLD